MFWSFLAVFFSGWLYIDASYRGPQWQRWVFKFTTLFLLLALAWQAPVLNTTDYFILLGLLTTLISGILPLLPKSHMLYTIGTSFLSYLFYTISFSGKMSQVFFWPISLTLIIAGTLVLASIWNRLETLRWPICTFIGMALVMVWLTAEQYHFSPTSYNLSLCAGTLFLMLNNFIWLFSYYRHRFNADRAIIATCYFLGHFMIVRSLYL